MKNLLSLSVFSLCFAHSASAYHHSCNTGEAMNAVLEAVKRNDADAFAAQLPMNGAVVLTTTLEKPPLSSFYDAEELANSLREGTFAYNLLIKDETLDSFGDVFSASNFDAWRVVDDLIAIPPGPGYNDQRTFIRFVCTIEGPRIAEIGWPAS